MIDSHDIDPSYNSEVQELKNATKRLHDKFSDDAEAAQDRAEEISERIRNDD